MSYQFQEEMTPHTWRTEIPNIIEDFLIDPYEFRLYVHMKRRADENGACRESIRTMAKACGMCESKVRRIKKKFEKPFKEFGNKPLIRSAYKKKDDGSDDTCLITIEEMCE